MKTGEARMSGLRVRPWGAVPSHVHHTDVCCVLGSVSELGSTYLLMGFLLESLIGNFLEFKGLGDLNFTFKALLPLPNLSLFSVHCMCLYCWKRENSRVFSQAHAQRPWGRNFRGSGV